MYLAGKRRRFCDLLSLGFITWILISAAPAFAQGKVRVPIRFVAPDPPGGAQASITAIWTAPGDDSLSGIAAAYEFRYRAGVWDSAAVMAGGIRAVAPTPMPSGSTQTLELAPLTDGATYSLALRTIDDAGNLSRTSNGVRATARAKGARAAGYALTGRDAWGYTFVATLYRDSTSSMAPTPGPPGSLEQVWTQFSPPWTGCDPEGVDYTVSPRWEDGTQGAPCARVRIALCMPDTNVCLDRDRFQRPPDYGGVRIASWDLDPAATSFLRLENQAQVQDALHPRICQIFSFWCRGGRCDSCP